MYRVGFPGWKLAARVGVPLKLRIEVMHDRESNSYWSTSPDLDGLVVTGRTLDELRSEVRIAAMALLDIALHGQKISATPELRFRDDAMCAA